jgi:hypothetical protein
MEQIRNKHLILDTNLLINIVKNTDIFLDFTKKLKA